MNAFRIISTASYGRGSEKSVHTRFKCPLRTEQALHVHAPQRRGVDAVTELLRPDVADQVCGCVGVPVHMVFEAEYASGRFGRSTIIRHVELLSRERRRCPVHSRRG